MPFHVDFFLKENVFTPNYFLKNLLFPFMIQKQNRSHLLWIKRAKLTSSVTFPNTTASMKTPWVKKSGMNFCKRSTSKSSNASIKSWLVHIFSHINAVRKKSEWKEGCSASKLANFLWYFLKIKYNINFNSKT